MTRQEIWDYIATRQVAQLATLNADGSPHLTTVWFALLHNRIVFETNYKSQKARNIERDERIALLFGDGVRFHEQRGVTIKARAKVITDREQVLDIVHGMYMRRMDGLSPDALRAAAEHIVDRRVAVVVEPMKLASWNHTKLR